VVTPWIAPDVEQLIVDYLETVLAVPVGDKPGTGSEFVVCRRTGGVMATPVSDRPQLTFHIYARRPGRAAELFEAVRGAIRAIAGTVLDDVSVKEVTEAGGPALVPDPVFEELVRYQYTVLLHLRAHAPA
jgi:hypothetical protein